MKKLKEFCLDCECLGKTCKGVVGEEAWTNCALKKHWTDFGRHVVPVKSCYAHLGVGMVVSHQYVAFGNQMMLLVQFKETLIPFAMCELRPAE